MYFPIYTTVRIILFLQVRSYYNVMVSGMFTDRTCLLYPLFIYRMQYVYQYVYVSNTQMYTTRSMVYMRYM